jgi:hypothetical protein
VVDEWRERHADLADEHRGAGVVIDNSPLDHGFAAARSGHTWPMITILLIVLIVLLLTGGIGYRRSRL